MSRRIVTSDIGGTHARFALATVDGGRVLDVSEPVTLKTAEHGSFQSAREEFGRRTGEPLPRELAIAFAGPIGGELLKLTNNSWQIRPASLPEELAVDRLTIVNDFGAVGHAVASLESSCFSHVCGPTEDLPKAGVISILGPGTGLGVAAILRIDGAHHVIATEGGHIDFAPLDSLEDRLLQELRDTYGRVSVERLLSGPGLVNLYRALGTIEARALAIHDERQLWAGALEGTDGLAAAALDRFCMILGAVAGDLALAQGAGAVVIGGGLGLRLAEHLPRSGFRDRFVAKGRYERLMTDMPVKLLRHPQPGLVGAATAFAREHA